MSATPLMNPLRPSEEPSGTAEGRVLDAVTRARAAAPSWAQLGFAERARLLRAWKRVLVSQIDEFGRLIHDETGKPFNDARLEMALAIDHLGWAASHAAKVLRRRRVRPGLLGLNLAASVEYEALGVVGVIGPWNYPIFTPMGSIAYALAAGNTVVFKPSEHAPHTGARLVSTFVEALSEDAVLQVVTGASDAGAALCRAGVDKIGFTGSTATARKVMAACAESLTPVLIEAGGKDAAIVAADADLDAAADAVAFGAIGNAGQSCTGIERAYVEAPAFDEFVAKVAAIAGRIRVGVDPSAHIGPITMPSQVPVIERHIDDAIAHGARAVVGGRGSIKPPFVYPAVLVDVPEDSEAMREETFGPTLTITRVESLDEAVTKTNGSRYGLGAAVFSRRRRTALSVARRLRAGMVSINGVMTFALVPALPFGGVADSGFGRIHGPEGLREFARAKSVARRRFRPPVQPLSFARAERDVAATLRVVRLRHGKRWPR